MLDYGNLGMFGKVLTPEVEYDGTTLNMMYNQNMNMIFFKYNYF